MEQGREPASASFTAAVSTALGVLPQELTGQPFQTLLAQEGVALGGAQELQALLTEGPFLHAVEPASPAGLESDLAALRADRHQDRSLAALKRAPSLLRQLHGLVRSASGEEDREHAWGLLADAYANVSQITYRFGLLTMAATLLERMEHAAKQAGQQLRVAHAAQQRALLLLSHAAYDIGQRCVERSLDLVGPPQNETALALAGSAHLRGAVLAARALDLDRASAHLDEAEDLARRIGHESGVFDTNFGPGNVAIHRVAVELEAGDPGRAAHTGEHLRLPADVKPTRVGRHWQDMARAHLLSGSPAKAFAALQKARAVAPQQTRHHPQVHETMRALAAARHHPSPAVTAFARWLGVRA